MRLVQHKKEAFYFYSFLSIFYDKLVNPLFWTERMREQALDLAEFSPELTVVDVGSGTGFTTQGIVRRVPARQLTCLDQSPHQMARARRKPDLRDCTFVLGDAENLPFATDSFDRYVSAGSIEYWPDPQRGISEAYRVVKPGGLALMIGPLEPEPGLGRLLANTWMLFPQEKQYRDWYEQAGFVDLRVKYVRPHWFRRRSEYGLALCGRKPRAGEPLATIPPAAVVPEKLTLARRLRLIGRVLLGSLAGFAFIPAALLGYLFSRRRAASGEGLNGYQIAVLAGILLLVVLLIFIFRK